MLSTLASRFIKSVCVLLILCGFHATEVFAGDTVRIGGTGTGLGLISVLAKIFEKSNQGVKIHVMPSLGSSGGIRALGNRALDIAISARALSVEELKTGVTAEEYARTPFVFIVNHKVKKSDVTSRELVMIYKEELKTWPNGELIRLIQRPITDTDTMLLAKISMEMKLAVAHANTIPERIMAVTDQEVTELAEKISGSLGGSTLTQIETEKPQVKVLSYNGIKPSTESLKKGSYRLSKPLYLVTTKYTSKSAMKFILFLHSAKGRAISAKMGALSVPSLKGEQ